MSLSRIRCRSLWMTLGRFELVQTFNTLLVMITIRRRRTARRSTRLNLARFIFRSPPTSRRTRVSATFSPTKLGAFGLLLSRTPLSSPSHPSPDTPPSPSSLRNLTYSAPLYCDVTLKKYDMSEVSGSRSEGRLSGGLSSTITNNASYTRRFAPCRRLLIAEQDGGH